jgi:hypothetical protein
MELFLAKISGVDEICIMDVGTSNRPFLGIRAVRKPPNIQNNFVDKPICFMFHKQFTNLTLNEQCNQKLIRRETDNKKCE